MRGGEGKKTIRGKFKRQGGAMGDGRRNQVVPPVSSLDARIDEERKENAKASRIPPQSWGDNAQRATHTEEQGKGRRETNVRMRRIKGFLNWEGRKKRTLPTQGPRAYKTVYCNGPRPQPRRRLGRCGA